MEPTVIVLVVVVALLVAALVVAGVLLARRRRSRQLQERYGPEYEREVAVTGDARRAEERLLEREERHQQLDVRELRPEERERYGESWAQVQREFVDDPVHAVQRADALVVDIMRARGYPVEDAARRTEEVSVAHPDIVQRYRDARAVKEATEHGPVDTEQQRHAVTSYRALVAALLGDDAHREEHTR